MRTAILLAFLSLTGASQDTKPQAPSSTDRAKAEKEMRSRYKVQLAKPTPALAAQLALAGEQASEDPLRFVLLETAVETAVQTAEPLVAARALRDLGKFFDFDTKSLRLKALKGLERTCQSPESGLALAATCSAFGEEAERQEDYDLAVQLHDDSIRAMNRARDAVLKANKADLGDWLFVLADYLKKKRDAENLQKEYSPVKTARATLTRNSNDPTANLVVGKFLCLSRRRWQEGLPFLTRCGDPTLSAMAEKDLAAAGQSGLALGLGDGWMNLAESERTRKVDMQERAVFWYSQAWSTLQGENKDVVRQKIKSVLLRPLAASPPKAGNKGTTDPRNRLPANWQELAGGPFPIALDETYAYDGKTSLRIGPSEADASVLQTVLKPSAGVRYTATARVLTEGTVKPLQVIVIYNQGKSGTTNHTAEAKADNPWWTEVRIEFTSALDLDTLHIKIGASGFTEGKVWIDGVSIKDEFGHEVLRNGKLEGPTDP
jgi:hypothetical protein